MVDHEYNHWVKDSPLSALLLEGRINRRLQKRKRLRYLVPWTRLKLCEVECIGKKVNSHGSKSVDEVMRWSSYSWMRTAKTVSINQERGNSNMLVLTPDRPANAELEKSCSVNGCISVGPNRSAGGAHWWKCVCWRERSLGFDLGWKISGHLPSIMQRLQTEEQQLIHGIAETRRNGDAHRRIPQQQLASWNTCAKYQHDQLKISQSLAESSI